MIRGRRKALIRYFLFIFYVFLLALIIITGNKRTQIVTSNVNNVKSLKSSRIVHEIEYGDIKSTYYARKMVTNTQDIRKYGSSSTIEFMGTLTGYGPDCPGCLGMVYCKPNPNVQNGKIYYTDKTYGKIRIVAADYAIPCGSIIKISNFKFIPGDSFYAIVLDRGSAIVGMTMDLLYPSEADTVIIGRQRNIKFTIERWGW